jgi:hypothetical protein
MEQCPYSYRGILKATRIVIVLLLGIMLLVGLACGDGGEPEQTPTPTPLSGFITYTNEVNGFSFSYPDDWQLASDELSAGTDVMFLASVACSDVTTNFNVVSEDLPYSMSVQGYFENGKSYLQAFTGYTPISDDELTVSGEPSIKHIYTWLLSGQTLKQMQVYLVQDETAWVLTFTTAPNCWSQYEATFNTITDSFQLLN